MAGIDLATAQTHLDLWLGISSSLNSARSVTHNNRTYTRDDLDSINRTIDTWDRRVQRLSRGSAVSVQRVVVND